jgi:trehalose 6-phosphate phosphatase
VGATDGLLAPLRDDPGNAAVLLDFDGTLAPIVDDPATARPVPGVVEVLTELRSGGRLVAVLSGRPVAFLAAHLPSEIAVFGLYGLERRVDGEVRVDDSAAAWQPMVDAAVVQGRAELSSGIEVEHKGLSLTLHFRRHPGLGAEAEAWAAAVSAESGLVSRPAKKSIELHPPVPVDKGSVVDELVAGRRSACFIGDDIGDLPAFDALDRFEAAGGYAVRVLVRTSETAAELEGRADLEVDGPPGALALLRSIAGQ